MSVLRYTAILFLMTLWAHGQTSQRRHADFSNQAGTPVEKLYQLLIARPIGGIPGPQRMSTLAPYLSGSLLNRITQARACGDDWFRQHPKNDVKAPLAWLEFGLFSGADDRSGPQTFQIEKIQSENDGSYRAYVRLTEGAPPGVPWTWQVADVITREEGRYVIDDVIFLKDKDVETDSLLSEVLTKGCDGSHWVGFDKAQNQSK